MSMRQPLRGSTALVDPTFGRMLAEADAARSAAHAAEGDSRARITRRNRRALAAQAAILALGIGAAVALHMGGILP